MRILFVNQFLWPDLAATGQQLADLAGFLAQQGHEVHVLCSRGRYDTAASRIPLTAESDDLVIVHRLWTVGLGKRSTIGRVIEYALFHMLCGVWTMTRSWRFAVIVTLTTPPLIGVYATLMKLLSLGRVRHVCWAMDLHPDAEFVLGLWNRRNPIWRLVDLVNAMHFRLANAVVALGQRMKERLVAKGVRPARIEVISSWQRADRSQPIGVKESTVRIEHGLADRFVVMYAGNAGLVHTFDAVCQAMKDLSNDPRIVFVFAGGGRRQVEILDFAQQHCLKNLRILPYMPHEYVPQLLAAADVHLVTLRDGMSGIAVPCKLYSSMAAGRPTIYVGPADSDTADHLRQAGAGPILPTDAPQALVDELRRLAEDPAECQRLGEKGHLAFLSRHERLVCCRQWAALLESVVGTGRP